MKQTIVLTMGMYLVTHIVQSQTTNEFKPGGKPFMRIYTNFHTTFSDGRSVSAFGITRAYLGYEYTFSKNFDAKANIDVANPGVGGLEMTAFIKNAFVRYQTEQLSALFGLIPTTQFKLQEHFWGYRYLEKSFQDAYDFNASADLGVSMSYQLTDFLSADIIVANGEGYKKLQADSVLRTGFGITLEPTSKLISRVYYDFSSRETSLSSLAFFTGYTSAKFSVAAEYNKQMNADFQEGHDLSGPSFYATFQTSENLKLFARYDRLSSNRLSGDESAWNLQNDGELFLAGIEYEPIEGVKLAPNFRGWNPAQNGEPFSSSIFLNCEIKL